MEKDYKFTLEPYKGMSTRHLCPSCNKKEKTFTRYIDKGTGKHLHKDVGKCSREINCGYHYPPKRYFQNNNIPFDKTEYKANRARFVPPAPPKPISFIPIEELESSLKAHETDNTDNTDNFVGFLINRFGDEVATRVVEQYYIGTSKKWNGATVFWQIDNDFRIRSGKIMLYTRATGKRVKPTVDPITGKETKYINWVHSVMKLTDFNLVQCLFGCHLLTTDVNKAVAIVESEKTAIIASIYLPEFIWVAVGSLTNLNAEKCNILKGRNVTLFPDLNCFEKWSSKAKELSHIAPIAVSDLLERKATEEEKAQGLDLADYLLRFSHIEFIQSVEPQASEAATVEPTADDTTPPTQQSFEARTIEQPEYITNATTTSQSAPNYDFSTPEKLKHIGWEQDIAELEDFFTGRELPPTLKLIESGEVLECSLFVESHMATVKANNGNNTFIPYLERLKALKQKLS